MDTSAEMALRLRWMGSGVLLRVHWLAYFETLSKIQQGTVNFKGVIKCFVKVAGFHKLLEWDLPDVS